MTKQSAENTKRMVDAVKAGDHASVRSMLAAGVSPDTVHSELTALFYAAGRGNVEMMEILVEAGANVNMRMKASAPGISPTALHRAISRAHPLAITWLLAHGADPRVRDKEGVTAAHQLLNFARDVWAAAGDEYLVVTLERMLEQGIPVNQADSRGRTLLHLALGSLPNPVAVVEALMRRGANPLLADKDGAPALHQVCLGNRIEALRVLVELGTDINSTDANGQTPLHYYATAFSYIPAMGECLIQAGANVEAQDLDGSTPLARYLTTCPQGILPPKLSQLLDAGASLDTPDFEGITPHDIIHERGLAEVEMFLAARNARSAISDVIRIRPRASPAA